MIRGREGSPIGIRCSGLSVSPKSQGDIQAYHASGEAAQAMTAYGWYFGIVSTSKTNVSSGDVAVVGNGTHSVRGKPSVPMVYLVQPA